MTDMTDTRLKMNIQTIQEIKQNITPAQAIEFYTGQQMQRGKLLCPFHSDRHPSLSVKGDKWCCWACGEKGDVIDFVQKYHGDMSESTSILR